MMATVRVKVLAGTAPSYSTSGIGKDDSDGDPDIAQKRTS